jgi:aldehyde dehydrogenase (NAD+)
LTDVQTLAILKSMMEGFPVGDLWTPGNMHGPQISETQRHKVLGLIKSGIDSGVRLVTGGGIPENLATGYYVAATLLADVDPESQVAHAEIFGPVLAATPYDTDDEAIAIANNSICGLSGEVSGGDIDRAFEVAKRMRTGNVTINAKSHFGITSPFGGTKQSGLGYRNGEEGYKEDLAVKTIGMPE